MNLRNEEKGPIELLCKEIEIEFDRRLETPEMLVAFVSALVSHIASIRDLQAQIVAMGGTAPSPDSDRVLTHVVNLLESKDLSGMTEKATAAHDLIQEVASDDAAPCDHLIDMLSSCVSAIRFGLQTPCRSRHAAEAAAHVWQHVYGIRLFDQFTSRWAKEWARAQFQTALIARL